MSGRDEFIGNSRRNLVLKTANTIRVLVGDRYYNLDFTGSGSADSTEEKPVDSKFLIVEKLDKGNYPGDGYVIFTLDGGIYYTTKKRFVKYNSSNVILSEEPESSTDQSLVYNDSVTFNASIPFIVNSRNLVQNLNSQYLNGKDSSSFIEKADIIKLSNVIIDSIVSSDGSFYYKNGEFSFSNGDEEFISNKRIIGPGTEVLDYTELEDSKLVPYTGLLDSLLAILRDKDLAPCEYVNKMLTAVNVDELPDISILDVDEQYSFYEQLDFIHFVVKDVES